MKEFIFTDGTKITVAKSERQWNRKGVDWFTISVIAPKNGASTVFMLREQSAKALRKFFERIAVI